MEVLVLCDDYWHPAETPRAGLQPLEAAGYVFELRERAGDWLAAELSKYPAVILTKSNDVSSTERRPWVSAKVAVAFEAYVRGGGGLLVIHSGIVDYDDQPVMRGLLGGVFASHPPQCPVTVLPSTQHPLTADITPFTVFDEHYIITMDDAQADVFLTTTSEHGTQPGGWRRHASAGHVCVLTPGHNLPVWLHPAYQMLIERSLRWCHGDETA